MLLRELVLVNFRNYVRLALQPGEPITVLVGDNGQGKSNVLEAIYLLATTRSPRTSNDRELVSHYRDRLIGEGIDAPTLDELMRQFAAFLPFGYATFMVNSSTYQTEAFNTAHAARYSLAMLDHGTRDLIP